MGSVTNGGRGRHRQCVSVVVVSVAAVFVSRLSLPSSPCVLSCPSPPASFQSSPSSFVVVLVLVVVRVVRPVPSEVEYEEEPARGQGTRRHWSSRRPLEQRPQGPVPPATLRWGIPEKHVIVASGINRADQSRTVLYSCSLATPKHQQTNLSHRLEINSYNGLVVAMFTVVIILTRFSICPTTYVDDLFFSPWPRSSP